MTGGVTADPFVFRIEEVFRISPQSTILVGTIVSGSALSLAPCDAELVVGPESRGWIHLAAERMPGPRSQGRRAVETSGPVPSVEELGRWPCLLIHR